MNDETSIENQSVDAEAIRKSIALRDGETSHEEASEGPVVFVTEDTADHSVTIH